MSSDNGKSNGAARCAVATFAHGNPARRHRKRGASDREARPRAHAAAGSPALNALEDAHGLGRGVLHRLLRGATTDPREDTIAKAAAALGVTARWLRHGEGDGPAATARTVEREDRYPSRAQVIALARARGVAAPLLDALALEAHASDEDPGIGWWTDRLAALARADRRLGAALASASEDDGEDVRPKLPGRTSRVR